MATSTAGGLRSGRERKARTYSGREGETVFEGLFFWARTAGLQPGVFANAIHTAPAPTALRNFRRVTCVLNLLFLLRFHTQDCVLA